jgi:sugar fermentation stimulation protein A
MHFSEPLETGKWLKRYKRFFLDIELENGHIITAHLANTGSLKTCWDENTLVTFTKSADPTRKIPYSVQWVQKDQKKIMINTSLTNAIVKEALLQKKMSSFESYQNIEPEKKYGDSRLDFYLSDSTQGLPNCWIEVKNCTFEKSPGVASFPDAVTERGKKHLHELMNLKTRGDRVVMLYVISREGIGVFDTQQDIDPEYATELSLSAQSGLEVYAYHLDFNGSTLELGQSCVVKGLI